MIRLKEKIRRTKTWNKSDDEQARLEDRKREEEKNEKKEKKKLKKGEEKRTNESQSD